MLGRDTVVNERNKIQEKEREKMEKAHVIFQQGLSNPFVQ